MSISSQPIRRTLTISLAIAALLLGFFAIRASAAWTVSSAPLVASPASAQTTAAQLTEEQQRSAVLQDQLVALTRQTEEMTAALEAAQTRIESDSTHADQLVADLAAARQRLKTLEKSIRVAATSATKSTKAPAPATTGGGPTTHNDDDGPGDD